jgi:hypothetical protein|tara:strand:- start:1040 stop:1570 length:531 start_codon:yes stop_codon:yes gene_type:complete
MKTFLVIFLFLLSLSFNVAMLASQTIFAMASSAFTALTNMPTAASKTHPKNTKVNFKGKKVTVAQAVGSTTSGVKRRAAKTAAKSVSAMAFEATPFIGTAAIVSVTAWELKDLCETAKDMDALNRALNPDETTNDGQTSVCTIVVPTSEELQEKVSKRTAEFTNKFKTFFAELKEE